MDLPNRLVLFDNHFDRFRRHYPLATRLAIAVDLGYEGYEFHSLAPDDDPAWEEARQAVSTAGVETVGMYVVATGVVDEEADRLDAEIDRVERIIARLAELAPTTYLNLAVGGNPSPGSSVPHETGSVHARARHWERTAKLLAAADRAVAARGMAGNLYNHIWFMLDTPQAQLRALELADAHVLRPGIASIHAHLHQGVPDAVDLLRLPGMERLGYFALLNTWSAPAPFRTRPLDAGEIDFATWLGLLWDRGYEGPLITQAYDLGGDAYLTAARSRDYIRDLWDRFQNNPALKPFPPDWKTTGNRGE